MSRWPFALLSRGIACAILTIAATRNRRHVLPGSAEDNDYERGFAIIGRRTVTVACVAIAAFVLSMVSVVAAPAALADAPLAYSVQNLGAPPFYGNTQNPYFGCFCKPSAPSSAGTVVYPLAGLLVDGQYKLPANAHKPQQVSHDQTLDSASTQGDFVGVAVNGSGVVGGAVLTGTSGNTPVAAVWSSATSTDYSLVDLSAVAQSLPSGASINYSVVGWVPDTGSLFGTVRWAVPGQQGQQGQGGVVTFKMSSPTARATVVSDPVTGAAMAPSSVAYPWIYATEDRGSTYRLVNLVAGTSTVRSPCCSAVSSSGTTVDQQGLVTRPDGTSYQLVAPGATQVTNLGIADSNVVGGIGLFDTARGFAWDRAGSPTDLSSVVGTSVSFAGIGATGRISAPANNSYDVYLLTPNGKAEPIVNSTSDNPAINSGTKGCDTGKTVTINGASKTECTLRAAIQAENAGSVTQKSITFALPAAAGKTIALTSALPALTADGVTIDGLSGPGGSVTIDGTALPAGSTGLHISGGHDVVQGMTPQTFKIGILIDAAAGNDVVRACSIGVLPGTTSATGLIVGVKVLNSPSVTIGGATSADGNVFGYLRMGVLIDGSASSGATVQSNYLGTNSAGDAIPVTAGVEVYEASGARIGGRAPTPGAAPGNVFNGVTETSGVTQSGSAAVGVIGQSSTVSGTTVSGNLIGLKPDGTTAPAGHFLYGVLIGGRTSGTVVGGTTPGTGNVIADAAQVGVGVSGTLTSGTQVLGNLIGTDVSGLHVHANGAGVAVNGASTTTVGTPGAGRNVIVGGSVGVGTRAVSTPVTAGGLVSGNGLTPAPGTDNVTVASAMSTLISGNIVGPGADGTTVDAAHVVGTGVALAGIGETLGPNNQIAFTKTGVNVSNNSEIVTGNLIGTTPSGSNALPNGTGVSVSAGKGVMSLLVNKVPTVKLGVPGQKPNLISGNTLNVLLPSPALMQGNLVGTSSTGKSAIGAYQGSVAIPDEIKAGSGISGVQVFSSGDGAVIGGTQPGMGNVISGGAPATGNVQATGGLAITGKNTTVQGNDIGVGNDHTTPVPNAGYGINVGGGSDDTIGAPAPGGSGTVTAPGGNVVANNGGGGIIVGKGVTGVQLLSNSVHDNTAQGTNGGGILLVDNTSNHGIGAPFVSNVAQDAANTGTATDRTVVIGRAASAGATVQIFAATNCPAAADDVTPGQGSVLLTTATLDPKSKFADFSIAIPVQPVGAKIVVTNTDVRGTSGFSSCGTVAPAAAGSTSKPVTRPVDTQSTNGSGFTPGETVTGSVHSTPVAIGNQTADSQGQVRFTFVVPAGLEPGTHYVLLTGAKSGKAVAVPFTVYTTASAPQNVRVAPGKASTRLSWTQPADNGGATVTAYRVYRKTGNGPWTVRADVNAYAFTDTRLTGGVRYSYQVAAVNAAGISPASTAVAATPYSAPSAPRALQARAASRAVTLRWLPPASDHGAGVTAYVVRYATCAIGRRGCRVYTLVVRARSVNIRRLAALRRYTFEVIAVNRAGAGAPSRITATPRR